MSYNEAPIGIFDSGVGGLTVARAIADALPKESFIYYGDTIHLPYGDKSTEAIIKYSTSIVEFLLAEGCKAIVIACNTASAVAYQTLIEKFAHSVPIINVIDPVAEAVALRSLIRVGVIGTRATIKSGAYPKKLEEYKSTIQVTSLATPLLVPVIEEGLAQSSISALAIAHYLAQPELANIEALILGCTHYPILQKLIQQHYKNLVTVIDSPQIVAETVSQVLASRGILAVKKYGSYTFYLSDYTQTFEKIAGEFFGGQILLIEKKVT